MARRIAYIIDKIESPSAGTEKQLIRLIGGLDRDRFVPFLYLLQSTGWIEREFNLCETISIGLRGFKDRSFPAKLWRFRRDLKVRGIDLLQTFFVDANLFGVLGARLAGIRNIISSRRNQGYWSGNGYRILQRFLNRWVRLIVANSHDTGRWVQREEKFPESRIRVIHNGIDIGDFDGLPSDEGRRFRKEVGIPDSAPVVAIVANLRPVKGIEIFLQAAGIVARRAPSAYFLIVGGGPDQERLLAQSKSCAGADRIRFLGTRTDVPRILKGVDIGVLASKSESFSNSILEYLASGIPVVSTNVGGVQEIVVEGENGLLVEVGDAEGMADRILTLIEDPDSRKAMGLRGKRKVEENFSWADCIGRHEACYRDLLEGGDAC